ncbi:MAG: MucR family transcriptional regulator [Desulfovibrionaceae bacterium]|nr:MucR family transcriptional regulator [Desulfovibrionaceae bacterium]
MDEMMKEALDIVKAQASVREMTEEQIISMVKKLTESLRNMAISGDDGTSCCEEESSIAAAPCDPKKSVKEKSVVCLVCGSSFKVITKRHLAQHGLTSEEYREKFGLPKNMVLVCKSLQKQRKENMSNMRLWERRGKKAE